MESIEQAMSATTTRVFARTVPRDHPAADGHFPGNPIVPGALLLDLIEDVATEAFATSAPEFDFKAVKFLRVIRPGEELRIELSGDDPLDLSFRCMAGGELALSGKLSRGTLP